MSASSGKEAAPFNLSTISTSTDAVNPSLDHIQNQDDDVKIGAVLEHIIAATKSLAAVENLLAGNCIWHRLDTQRESTVKRAGAAYIHKRKFVRKKYGNPRSRWRGSRSSK